MSSSRITSPPGLSRAAVQWFRKHKRILPFRETRDPYAILVSEIMLQQTQVQTVVPYYERFLGRFPTVSALARAHEEEVLGLWAGLGYYRRARLLHAAAKTIVEQHAGHFPQVLNQIEQLPGVGRYTAGAVFSFAYNQPAPIVEANTARVFARLIGLETSLTSAEGKKNLWRTAEALLPGRNPREHNYALMEIGALVCRPSPDCAACPLTTWCRAYQEGRTAEIPVLSTKPEKLQRLFVGAVVQRGEHYLIRQIPEGEWHHGLFSFPAVPAPCESLQDEHREQLGRLLADVGRIRAVQPFAELQYTVTRHRVRLQVYRCTLSVSRRAASPFSWRTLPEICTLPLSSPQRKLLDLVKENDEFFGKTP